MKLAIGGWTRIWIAVSLFFFVVAVFIWHSDSAYSRDKAEKAYKNEVEAAQSCRDEISRGLAASATALDKLIYSQCDAAPAPTEQSAAQRRDDAISAGNAAAQGAAFNIFLWPTVVLGLFFAAIGWIRSGFRQRPV